jgi:hypothetical protein
MSSLSITINGNVNYISSTKNNDTTYTFPAITTDTYLMQGYNGDIYLDAFATGVALTFKLPVDSTTIP